MSQIFSKIRVGNSRRSTFDLSHNQVTSADFGQLLPICYRDMLPNDDFTVTPSAFVRLAPCAVPFYGQIKVRLHHFFVPYRILYDKWDAFISQSPSNYTVPPYFTVGNISSNLDDDPQFNPSAGNTYVRGTYCKLMSNLGLNPEIFNSVLGDSTRISAFPFLAYYRVWLDYFMDSNLNDHSQLDLAFKEIVKDGGDLDDYVADFLQYRNCCYKKDYFTTAKTSPQEGNASSVNVEVNPDIMVAPNYSGASANVISYKEADGAPSTLGVASNRKSTSIGQFEVEALRGAVSAQRYSERNNYVGSKIINRILAHFGIAPSAERLDMAEYIGGESFPIAVQDVTSHNSVSDLNDNYTTMGLGLQAGKGLGNNRNPKTVHYHAKEHGIFMTMMSIVPDTAYYQGLSKFWTKGVTGEALDYFTPEFENLGYQEILNRELYCPDRKSVIDEDYQSYDPKGVFGYSPRYSEYKFSYDVLGSDFVGPFKTVVGNPEVAGSYMDSWHLFRKLYYTESNPLALNNNFVEIDNHQENFDRVFQYTDNKYDHFYFNIHVDVKATRNMMGFAEPSIDATNMLGDGKSINLPYGGTRL